jgi:hypothetical protein
MQAATHFSILIIHKQHENIVHSEQFGAQKKGLDVRVGDLF